MTYLARYAHLKTLPAYKVGNKINNGNFIGIMGNTGKSTGPHLHFDLIQKEISKMYRLADIPNYIFDLPKLMGQYNYFIDIELFNWPVKITTSFGDPTYDLPVWKFHPGFDLVPYNIRETLISWNRSYQATVHMIGTDPGYGNYIILKYKVV